MSASLRARRDQRGWSQQELAERAGVSRQLIGAIEAERHSPRVSAAIGIARALGTTVEELFDREVPGPVPAVGEPPGEGAPVAVARVGETVVVVPVEHGLDDSERWGFPDAVFTEERLEWLPESDGARLVISGCDPLLGPLARLVERTSGQRILAAHASTGRSLAALEAGRVHGAIVHSPRDRLPAPVVPVRRWHLARWTVGLASAARGAAPSLDELAERRARVVQRDGGAASQQALERALRRIGTAARLPGPIGEGHVDVARRVAQGVARAGVTMEAAARAFELAYRPLEEHTVELWIDDRWASLPTVGALIEALSSQALQRRMALLGGYDLAGCGRELAHG